MKLTYGMVGGGQGAFIGDVHRKSIALDGKAELVAGCFSQDHQNTLATGKMLGLDEDRLYVSFNGKTRSILWSLSPPIVHIFLSQSWPWKTVSMWFAINL